MNELALFAGVGGGILGGHLLGWRTVAAVEIEDYPRRVLLQRQADGVLPRFPIWDDVQTFDGKPWRGKVDVVTGGFPCQDISCAGKGAGIDGSKSSMWEHMARIIGEVRPKYAFVENSPLLVGRGLGRVLGNFAKMRYDVKWCVLGADHIGLPHHRKRIWVLATDTNSEHVEGRCLNSFPGFREIPGIKHGGVAKDEQGLRSILKPYLCGSFNGIPCQVDRIKAIGNAQVPAVAALAFTKLINQT